MPVPMRGSAYSTNRGLWGVTIGGTETLDSKGSIPESAWVLSAGALEDPQPASEIEIEFARGVPAALDGHKLDPVALIEKLEGVGAKYGIGRGIPSAHITARRAASRSGAGRDLDRSHGSEAHAHGTQAREGDGEPDYGRSTRGQAARSRVPRHRGAALASSRLRFRKVRVQLRPGSCSCSGDVAAFADGREPRQVRRGGRRVDGRGRARLLEDHGFARDVPHPGRRAVRCARSSSTR